MKALARVCQGPETCAYLPDRQATTEFVIVSALSPEVYERLLNGGWRKFGVFLFRPVCAGCRACMPLRVSVEHFCPDRSARRAAARNADLRVEIGAPRVDAARVALWNRYHAARTEKKGWPAQSGDFADYAAAFVHSPLPAVEIALYDGQELCGILLADVTPATLSLIYHYYEAGSRRSLGTMLILEGIRHARRLGRPWVHMGYYVAGCGSMEYKARFRPCELLTPDGAWRRLA